MTDDAPDKEKRKHGCLWYLGWLLILYVVSFVPVMILAQWLAVWDVLPEPVGAVLEFVYTPLFWVVEWLGLLGPLAQFFEWAVRSLPAL
jgi:hypothetical protein